MNVIIEAKGKVKSGRSTIINTITAVLAAKGFDVTTINEHSVSVVGDGSVLTESNNQEQATSSAPESILANAHRIVHSDREQTYGDAGKNFRTIAVYWATHLKAAYSIDLPLTEADVCGMMVLLKQARLANNPNHKDSMVDIAGYTELNSLIQQQKQTS